MNLKTLTDQNLLLATKNLVKKEREVLTEVLHHLREVERRRLYCDFGFQSLFEYAVKELKYSEGQAGRRLQAMRLIKEIPEIEQKIQTGALSLSNISQAQSFFRESKKRDPEKAISPKLKMTVLASLENKSAREGQKVLLGRQPEAALPKERERQVTESHTEMRFVMSGELKSKLDKLRSLLGPSAAAMGFAGLLEHMTDLAIDSQMAKRFGKKRTTCEQHKDRRTASETRKARHTASDTHKDRRIGSESHKGGRAVSETEKGRQIGNTLKVQGDAESKVKDVAKSRAKGITKSTFQGDVKAASESKAKHLGESAISQSNASIETRVAKPVVPKPLSGSKDVASKQRTVACAPTSESNSRNVRHIPRSVKYQVWRRDGGCCTNCESNNNINFDHIRPVALGGGSEPDNLRLLCFNCNQRQAIKSFGLATVERFLGR